MNNSSPKITLLLLTKNESQNVSQNFKWLQNCQNIDQIICIDDFSTDDTLVQLNKLSPVFPNIKFNIHKRLLSSDFSKQRQFALIKSKNDWILWLDADEVPQPPLAKFLNNFDPSYYNYSFLRHDIFLGHPLKHGETANQHFLRLFDKNHGQFQNPVHEIWHSTKPVFHTNLAINHFSHPNLTSFLQKINFYTDIRAQQLYSQKVKTNILQILFYPTVKFVQNFFFRFGFLDSTPGIIMALSMSFHSFLVRAKLWKLWQK